MGSEIQKVGATALETSTQAEWTKERRELVRRTVAPDATEPELEMFLHIASKSGLDPLRRQVHFMKHAGRVTIVADINGLQARAAREADFMGIAHAVVHEGEEFIFDHANQVVVKHASNPFGGKRIVGAWATVWRRDKKPFSAVVRFEEFTNGNNPLWKSKPATMIDKVAKSTALRLAYPEQLGNVYEHAEVDESEPMGLGVLSKPDLPAVAATRTVAPSARLERAPVPVEAEVVEAAPTEPPAVASREPGADDGEDDSPVVDSGPEGWEVWVDEISSVQTREEYNKYAARAESAPKGSPERKALIAALKAASSRLQQANRWNTTPPSEG